MTLNGTLQKTTPQRLTPWNTYISPVSNKRELRPDIPSNNPVLHGKSPISRSAPAPASNNSHHVPLQRAVPPSTEVPREGPPVYNPDMTVQDLRQILEKSCPTCLLRKVHGESPDQSKVKCLINLFTTDQKNKWLHINQRRLRGPSTKHVCLCEARVYPQFLHSPNGIDAALSSIKNVVTHGCRKCIKDDEVCCAFVKVYHTETDYATWSKESMISTGFDMHTCAKSRPPREDHVSPSTPASAHAPEMTMGTATANDARGENDARPTVERSPTELASHQSSNVSVDQDQPTAAASIVQVTPNKAQLHAAPVSHSPSTPSPTPASVASSKTQRQETTSGLSAGSQVGQDDDANVTTGSETSATLARVKTIIEKQCPVCNTMPNLVKAVYPPSAIMLGSSGNSPRMKKLEENLLSFMRLYCTKEDMTAWRKLSDRGRVSSQGHTCSQQVKEEPKQPPVCARKPLPPNIQVIDLTSDSEDNPPPTVRTSVKRCLDPELEAEWNEMKRVRFQK